MCPFLPSPFPTSSPTSSLILLSRSCLGMAGLNSRPARLDSSSEARYQRPVGWSSSAREASPVLKMLHVQRPPDVQPPSLLFQATPHYRTTPPPLLTDLRFPQGISFTGPPPRSQACRPRACIRSSLMAGSALDPHRLQNGWSTGGRGSSVGT